MIEDLKQVRDALASSEVISRGGRYVAIGYGKAKTILATLDRIIADGFVVPDGHKLDMWTLPYNSNESYNRIRKVISTLGLPENSTGVWGALKQLENEIRHALVSDYNAAPTPALTDGYVTVKMGFPNITGSKELVAVPVEFLMSDGSFYRLENAAPTPDSNLQKDINLVDGVNECKFEAPAQPEEVDVEALKRSFDTYLAENEMMPLDGKERLLRDIFIDHLAATGRLKV